MRFASHELALQRPAFAMTAGRGVAAAVLALALLSSCSKTAPEKAAPPPIEVSVQNVQVQTVPVAFEFVGQTESSQQVEIRARVNGFLEKRVYTEGSFVEPGQVLFRMDTKPFEANLKAAKAELAQQQARLDTARANLKRVKPLVEDKALAIKDLDDSTDRSRPPPPRSTPPLPRSPTRS